MEKSFQPKPKNSFVKQAAILAAAGLLARVLGFAYRVPLTGMITDAGNGYYIASYNIYNFMLVLSSAGIPAAISKMVAERDVVGDYGESHRIFHASMIFSVALGLFFALLLGIFPGFIANHILKQPQTYLSLITLAPTVLVVSALAVFRGYFQGKGTTIPTAVSQVIEQIFDAIFSLLLAFLFMKITLSWGDKYALGAAGSTVGTGIGSLVALLFVAGFYWLMRPVIFRQIHRQPKTKSNVSQGPVIPMRTLVKQVMLVCLPFIAGTAVFSFASIIDTVMIQSRLLAAGLSSDAANSLYGIYGGKYITLTTLPVAISAAFALATIPSLVASAKLGDKAAVRAKVNTSMRLTMLISVPAAVGLGVLGTPIIQMLFPSAPAGGALLSAGAVSIIFLSLNQILTGILQGTGNIKAPVIAAAVGVVVKIILNYVLIAIPSINIYGAVISTTGCYLAASAVNLWFFRKTNPIRLDFISILAKPLAAAAVMGLWCYVSYSVIHILLRSNALATLCSIVSGIIVYLLAMLLLRGIYRRDVEMAPGGNWLARKLFK